MNSLEKKMVALLTELKERHNVIGVKAEFEAEGTRQEEAMRLKEVSLKAGLGMTLKIGGCEAIRDMFEASDLGVEHLVAPMVETPYALKKYLGALKIAFTEEQRDDIHFLINLETITACNNFSEMLKLPEIGKLNGIVLGRVDLTGSMTVLFPRVTLTATKPARWFSAVRARWKTTSRPFSRPSSLRSCG
jgi:4-hydroxy-2-oxoheptanedioate aldolase